MIGGCCKPCFICETVMFLMLSNLRTHCLSNKTYHGNVQGNMCNVSVTGTNCIVVKSTMYQMRLTLFSLSSCPCLNQRRSHAFWKQNPPKIVYLPGANCENFMMQNYCGLQFEVCLSVCPAIFLYEFVCHLAWKLVWTAVKVLVKGFNHLW